MAAFLFFNDILQAPAKPRREGRRKSQKIRKAQISSGKSKIFSDLIPTFFRFFRLFSAGIVGVGIYHFIKVIRNTFVAVTFRNTKKHIVTRSTVAEIFTYFFMKTAKFTIHVFITHFKLLLSRVSRVRFPGGSPNSNNPNTIQIDGVFGFLFYL